jgi:hypothetical protein
MPGRPHRSSALAFQIVHHGLWDYDPAAARVLVSLRRGRVIDAVALAGRRAFLRLRAETGTPVWPIEERPVPASDVPGSARREPTLSTWPKPSLRALAMTSRTSRRRCTRLLALYAQHRSGPLFTPPSLEGTLARPGIRGGAGWGSVAYDPPLESCTLRPLTSLADQTGAQYRLCPHARWRFATDPEIVGQRVDIRLPGQTGVREQALDGGIPIKAPWHPHGDRARHRRAAMADRQEIRRACETTRAQAAPVTTARSLRPTWGHCYRRGSLFAMEAAPPSTHSIPVTPSCGSTGSRISDARCQ